jgi:hypothetical protein
VERANIMEETLAQAISSTTLTTAIRIFSGCENLSRNSEHAGDGLGLDSPEDQSGARLRLLDGHARPQAAHDLQPRNAVAAP